MADPGLIDVHAEMREQVRTLKRGVQRRYVVDFQIQDLVVDTRAGPLNDEFALIVKTVLQDEWRKIRKPASDATLARRERYRRMGAGFAPPPKGKRSRKKQALNSYQVRYTGATVTRGKIGHMPPTTSIRYGIDSGRTVDNVFLRPRRRGGTESVVTLNAPADRMVEAGFGDRALDRRQFRMYLQTMQSYIPLLRGKVSGTASRAIKAGMADLAAGVASNNEALYRRKLAERNRKLKQVLRQLGGFL